MRIPLLFLIAAATGFGAELHLDSAAIEAGKPARLSLQLQTDGAELSGVQFDLEFDATRFDVKLEIGPAAEDAVKVLQSNTLAPGKQRVLIFGFNRAKIADGIVAFANVSLKARSETRVDDADASYLIRISEPVGTSAEGQAVQVKGTSSNVTTGRGTDAATRSKVR